MKKEWIKKCDIVNKVPCEDGQNGKICGCCDTGFDCKKVPTNFKIYNKICRDDTYEGCCPKDGWKGSNIPYFDPELI